MNTKILYQSALFLSVILCSSCKKEWLDQKANKNQVTPSTLKDFQAMLDNNNIMNGYSPGLGEVCSDGHYISETNWANSFLFDHERNAYTWTKNWSNTQVHDWFGPVEFSPFARIAYCNIILKGLEKLTINNLNDQLVYDNIKGQALFQRARTFFELAQIFAPPFDSSNADIQLGIPLRTDPDINVITVRSPLKETYETIINDLQLASGLLPINPLYKFRGSKPASLAYLSRVFLSLRDFENAGKYSDSCIIYFNTLLDYNSLNPALSFPIPVLNNEVIFQSTLVPYGCNMSYARIDSTLFLAFKDFDLRKIIFFQKNTDGTVSFKGNYTGSASLFAGVALDEVILTRAECFARKGQFAAAINDLNSLLIKRFKNGFFIPTTALDANDALNQILLERKKEIMLRGLRWIDLRRLNKEPQFQITLTRNISGKTYTLEPNSHKYTIPIPDDIILIAGIPQNSGW